MKRLGWTSWLVILGLFLQPPTLGAAAQALPVKPPQGETPRIIEEPGGLVVEWLTPAPTVESQSNGEISLNIPGYIVSALPGEYRLPQNSLLLALPPGAHPSVDILVEETNVIDISGPVTRALAPEGILRGPRGDLLGGDYRPAVETSPVDVPVVAFSDIGIQRGLRLARLVFTPVRPAQQGWVSTRRVKARLNYHAPQPSTSSGQMTENDPVLQHLRGQVANPSQVISTASPARAGLQSANLALATPAGQTAALEVSSTGITQVTYAALKTAGFPVDSINPANLQLRRNGIEVAMEWEGDTDTVFEAGERFLFFAEPRFSRWTAVDVYWLQVGQTPGTRIAGRMGGPAGMAAGPVWRNLLVEQNIAYTPDCYCGSIPAGRDGDHWAWDSLSNPGKPSGSYSFQLSSVDLARPAHLNVWMIGSTDVSADVDHLVNVQLNGANLGVLQWNGKQNVLGAYDIPAETLKNGVNSLTLVLPGISGVSVEGAWLDAFEVKYAQGTGAVDPSAIFTGDQTASAYTLSMSNVTGLRVYDITTTDTPVRLGGVVVQSSQVSFGDGDAGDRRYVLAAESGLLLPARIRLQKSLQTGLRSGADYLVITYPDFTAALAPLTGLRAAQGFQTAVEDVEAIYDQYSGGRMDPEGIHAFLADVYQRWSLRPLYVLLVGDGTDDPRRYHTDSSSTYIPPMLADVDPWAGETAADNRFVTVDGDDNLPDMIIGRLPANSLAEAQSMVTKITGYEAQGFSGNWASDLTLVADNADSAGNFVSFSENVAGLLASPPYRIRRLYYQPASVTETQMRQWVQDGFNQGSSVMIFTGHASIHQWAAENFFHISQLPLLTNPSRLPLLLEMSCLTGAFQVPGFQTLDESLLRDPQGGVVAVWGATGLGIATGHEVLAKTAIQDLYRGGPQSIGLAIMDAKMILAAARPYNRDLLDTYVLLGDPATILDPNKHHGLDMYLPSIQR